jgi:hypothetical protein
LLVVVPLDAIRRSRANRLPSATMLPFRDPIPVQLGAESMRSQINLPPDAQARQKMLAQLHAEAKSVSEKPTGPAAGRPKRVN